MKRFVAILALSAGITFLAADTATAEHPLLTDAPPFVEEYVVDDAALSGDAYYVEEYYQPHHGHHHPAHAAPGHYAGHGHGHFPGPGPGACGGCCYTPCSDCYSNPCTDCYGRPYDGYYPTCPGKHFLGYRSRAAIDHTIHAPTHALDLLEYAVEHVGHVAGRALHIGLEIHPGARVLRHVGVIQY